MKAHACLVNTLFEPESSRTSGPYLLTGARLCAIVTTAVLRLRSPSDRKPSFASVGIDVPFGLAAAWNFVLETGIFLSLTSFEGCRAKLS